MKKFVVLLLALSMVLSLCACGQEPAAPADTEAPAASSEPAAEAILYSSTTLTRNGKKLYVELKNFSDRLSYVEHCCVSSVTDYGFLKDRINMKVPGGIHIGMSEKDLKNAMPEGYDTGNSTYYLYDHERNTDLWVQVEDGKVSAIQYQIDEWNR